MNESPTLMDVLRDIPDADLIESWQHAERELTDSIFTRDMHRGEILRRINESGMAGLETEKGTAIPEPTFGEYQWDMGRLRQVVLSRLLPPQLAECVKPAEPKVNTVAVKKYARLLGLSEAELAMCYERQEQTPKLRYHHPQPPLLEQLEASVRELSK